VARGRKTGGRQKGTRNRATEEARIAAAATGMLPLDYMLAVMRDAAADHKRRDAMAMAAAPYLHARLSTIDATLSPAAAEPSPERTSALRSTPTVRYIRSSVRLNGRRDLLTVIPRKRSSTGWMLC
jgi:hypothetical protein